MLDELESILCLLYPSAAEASRVVDQTSIPAKYIDLEGSAATVWHRIVTEADKRGLLAELVQVAIEDYPLRIELQQFYGALHYAPGGLPQASDEGRMSDRWGVYDVAKLGERITVLETRLPLLQAEIERRFDLLSEGQTANRAHTDAKFNEMATLIKATPVKPQNDRVFVTILVIGALVTATLLLILAYWFYVLTGGRLA